MNGKQLRNSILQWAIQGKLVPQDPNDEPASVLLERIRAEKKRLVKEGKIKKDKNESIIYKGDDNSYYEKFPDGKVTCIDEEIPFEIPKGWEWARVKHICSMQAGKNIASSEISPIVTSTKIYPCFGGNGLRGYVSRCNTIGTYPIIGRQGALCGNVNMASGEIYATEHAVVTDNYNQTDVKWLFWFLTALNLNQYATATAQPGLAVSNIIEVLLPIPPRKEQAAIAQTLDRIEPIINRYDESETNLSKLNNAIKIDLQKSILQEAIQGKLVPQIASEGDASDLLQQIEMEKQRLIKEGKLKKKDLVSSTIFRGDDNKYYEKTGKDIVDITEEIPFEIPENWEWSRLKNIVFFNPKNVASDDTVAAFMPMNYINPGYGSGYKYDEVQWGKIKKGFSHFAKGDIAFAKITPCFQNRKSFIANNLPSNIGAGTTELIVLTLTMIHPTRARYA